MLVIYPLIILCIGVFSFVQLKAAMCRYVYYCFVITVDI